MGFGKSGCVLVGCYYGLVEVGGDDACVDVIGQRGGVGVILGDVVGEGDESRLGKVRVHVVGGRAGRVSLGYGVDVPFFS